MPTDIVPLTTPTMLQLSSAVAYNLLCPVFCITQHDIACSKFRNIAIVFYCL